ncbi:MAG: thioredoxin family protein [Sulfurimonas sp.]|jgi:thiol:disulfide interchange protein|nr:thioredoxin family protein [Sulfurimonas sp.]
MKIFIFTIILISSLYSYELNNWMHNYDKALERAKQEHKDVYLFVGADECRFCDRFKDLTLSKKEVIDRLKKEYILLYLSRDQHKIPKKFAIKGVPRHYFLTSKGKIIHDDRGSREPAGFYDMLDEVDIKKD